MQHISQGGTRTQALRQVLHFSPKRGGISSCLKESTAYVIHIAYKFTPLFLLLALSYSLPLSVPPHLICSAPFPFWPYTLRLCSIPPSFHRPLCLLPCLSPDSLSDRARPC